MSFYLKIKLIEIGLAILSVSFLFQKISNDLRDVSPFKQVNLVLVFTKSPDTMFAQNLKAKWLGGKKNDLMVIIGSDIYPNISWVEVFSWSKNDIVNTTIRDSLVKYGKIDENVINIAIDGINKYWVRKPMSDFQYLQNEMEPSALTYFITFILVSIIVFVVVKIFMKNRN